MKKVISFLLSMCLLLSTLAIVPMESFANDKSSNDLIKPDISFAEIDRSYIDSCADDSDGEVAKSSKSFGANSVGEPSSPSNPCTTLVQGGLELRDGMTRREDSISIYLRLTADMDNPYGDMMDVAFSEEYRDGPNTGAYIAYQYSAMRASAEYVDNGVYCFVFEPEYFTTLEQESQVDTKVEEIIESLDLRNQDRITQLKNINTYLCDNVVYDYSDDRGILAHSAYASLIYGTSVCQGYAVAFYRFCRELDIDVNIVCSEVHAWNIVDADGNGIYYDVDATWDAPRVVAYGKTKFFLTCPTHSEIDEDHTRDYDFTTPEFNARYPMAEECHSASNYLTEQHKYTALSYLGNWIHGRTCTICGLKRAGQCDVTVLDRTDIGYISKSCSECNHSETISHTHSYTWTYNNDATYSSSTNYTDGTATGVCECGDKKSKTIDGTGLLRINAASVSLNSAVTLSVSVDKSRGVPFEDMYVKIEFGGRTYVIPSADRTESLSTTTRWQYDFNKIAPQYFAESAVITMYGVTEDGIVCRGHSVEYSVLKYCTTQLGKAANGNNLKKLLVEILYYGEADRIYRNNTTNPSPIASLSSTDKARHTTDVPVYVNLQDSNYAIVSNPEVIWKGIGLDVLGSVRPRYRFEYPETADLSDYSFIFKLNYIKGGEATYVVNSNTHPDLFAEGSTTTAGMKSAYVYCENVCAYQFNMPIDLTVTKNNIPVSTTFRFSVESYATKAQYRDGTQELKNLVDQMLRYGRAHATWAADKNA